MVQDKLWNVDLVRINGVIEIVYSSQIVNTLLHITGSECQEPPGLYLERERESVCVCVRERERVS